MLQTNLPVPAESEVLKAALALLRARGVMAWRNNTGAFAGTHNGKRRFVRFGVPGSSDIFGVLADGRFLAVEVKRPGKLPSAAQLTFLRAVNLRGGVALWCSDIRQFETVVDHVLAGGGVSVDEGCNVFLEPG